MRIVQTYSHLNGLEFLLVHQKNLWHEIEQVIRSVDGESCRTKISKEKRMEGRQLYAPKLMNSCLKDGFNKRDWKESRVNYWVTEDAKLIRKNLSQPASKQKQEIEKNGLIPISSYNQTDFVKHRVAVEVQLGKYAFVAFDLFVKHLAFFVSDKIDVGVEILPMKELQAKMSSGPAYYERELYNLIRSGRGVPSVPLVLVGISQ